MLLERVLATKALAAYPAATLIIEVAGPRYDGWVGGGGVRAWSAKGRCICCRGTAQGQG